MENQLAYNFRLNSCSNGVVTLESIGNKYVVLYFYPKDDTSGCTLEAQEFSKLKNEFNELNVAIFGISKENIDSHKKFIKKYDLTIDLLYDDSSIAEEFGVWVEKSMYGKKYMGIARTTFLIGENRKILKVWNNVSVPGHAKEVLDYIKSMN